MGTVHEVISGSYGYVVNVELIYKKKCKALTFGAFISVTATLCSPQSSATSSWVGQCRLNPGYEGAWFQPAALETKM